MNGKPAINNILFTNERIKINTMTKKVIMTESQIKNLIKESVIDETPESLFEMARVDNPNKDSTILGTKEVWIYGNITSR